MKSQLQQTTTMVVVMGLLFATHFLSTHSQHDPTCHHNADQGTLNTEEILWKTVPQHDWETISEEEAAKRVTHFHCHLHWWDAETRKIAFDLREKMAAKFPQTKVLQIVEKPQVATKPTMEILVPKQDMAELAIWLTHVRHPLMSILFHPLSPANYKDNLERSMWIGPPIPLNEEPLKNFDHALVAHNIPAERIVGFLMAEAAEKPKWLPELLPPPAQEGLPEWATISDEEAMKRVTHFHVHFHYWDEETKKVAYDLLDRMDKHFPGKTKLLQAVDKPEVATKPTLEILFAKEDYASLVTWLTHVKDPRMPILIHPLSPTNEKDNFDRALWLGPPIPLNRAALTNFDNLLKTHKIPAERIVGFLKAEAADKPKFLPELIPPKTTH